MLYKCDKCDISYRSHEVLINSGENGQKDVIVCINCFQKAEAVQKREEEIIAEIERQRNYVDGPLREACNKGIATTNQLNGMIEAYDIVIKIIKKEDDWSED